MKVLNILWILLGCIALALGVIGIFVPMLPTTPFLLLTLAAFTKGSTRMRRWFMGTAIYKKHVEKFNETRALTRKSKIVILALASSMLLLGFYFSRSIYARSLIILVMVIKYYVFIYKIKTIDSNHSESSAASFYSSQAAEKHKKAGQGDTSG